jgi:hypothetical protein
MMLSFFRLSQHKVAVHVVYAVASSFLQGIMLPFSVLAKKGMLFKSNTRHEEAGRAVK